MYPVLFKIGGLTIYSYGVMVALGFVVAIIWITRESKRLKQNPQLAMDLMFYIIVSAIVGSRLLHVLVSERERFFANPMMIFKVWEGGLVFYGGLIASLAVSIWFVRKHKMCFFLNADIFAPAIALGHGIGRIGCLLAGCCYGRVMDRVVWYSLVFPPNPKTFAPISLPLYPTQLIEAMGEFLIFFILLIFRKYKSFNGQLIATYLMLYAVMRAIIEYFRGDVDRGFVVGDWLSTSLFISILIFISGAIVFIICRRKKYGEIK